MGLFWNLKYGQKHDLVSVIYFMGFINLSMIFFRVINLIFVDVNDLSTKILLKFNFHHKNYTKHNILLDPLELGMFVNLRSNIYYINGYDEYFQTIYPWHQLVNASFNTVDKIPFVNIWMKIHPCHVLINGYFTTVENIPFVDVLS